MFVCERAALAGDPIVLAGPEGRHATTVRRMAPGERVDLTDGAGQLVECVVTGSRPGELHLSVLARRQEPPAQPALTVVQALLKGDRAELAVELMTEVGVDAIIPWAAERCVVRWQPDRADKALARWRSTAREAAKQSRRLWFPQVFDVATTAQVAEAVASANLALLLQPNAEIAVSAQTVPATGDVLLVVGPEGGVSPAETEVLTAAGAWPARLGPSVLRGSSAGAVAAAIVLSRTGRWA